MMNIVALEGRLTNNPRLNRKERPERVSLWCDFCLAVKKDYRRDGRPDADFIQCRVFGGSAEYLVKNGQKGKRVSLRGQIEAGTRVYEDGTSSYFSQIVVDRLWILDYKDEPNLGMENPSFDPMMDPDRFSRMPEDLDLPFA